MHHPANRPFYEEIVEELAAPHYVGTTTLLVPTAEARVDPRKYKNLRKMKLEREYIFGDDPRVYPLQYQLAREFKKIPNMHWGQKLIPISKAELAHRGNIMYPLWKSVFIDDLTTNMMINLVMPGIYAAGAFIISGTAETFDSVAIRDKYTYDASGKHIYEWANSEGRLTVNITDDPGEIATAMSDLAGIGEYLRADAGPGLLSDQVLVKVYEEAFATFPDAIARAVDGCIPDLFKKLVAIDGLPEIKVLFFDFLWAIYAAGLKNKIVHTRMNVDHLALKKVIYPFPLIFGARIRPNLVNVRLTSSRIYMFPRIGFQGCILGWGGGLVLDEHEVAREFGEDGKEDIISNTVTNNMNNLAGPKTEAFMSAEKRKALTRLEKKALQHGIVIKVFQKNYSLDAIVEMLALLDIYELSEQLAGYFETSSREYTYTNPPGSIDFLRRLSGRALDLFKTSMAITGFAVFSRPSHEKTNEENVASNQGEKNNEIPVDQPKSTNHPQHMARVEMLIEEFYGEYNMDTSCMLLRDRLQACLITEFMIIDSKLGIDGRVLTREELVARVDERAAMRKHFTR